MLQSPARNEFEMTAPKYVLEPSQLDAIEGRLAGTLKRVQPPSDFVRRLRGHIRLPERTGIVFRMREWGRLGLAVGSVLSGAVLAVTFARLLYQLFWRRSG